MKNILTPEQIQLFLNAFEKKIGKKTILIDIDGVIADFEASATKHATEMGITFQEFADQKIYRNLPGFYLGLDLIPGAKETIMKLDKVYDIIFVSAPSWGNIHCFTEKRVWIEKHFGRWAAKKMDLSFHKGHYFGHYLIDDRTKYGAGDFMGEHIMFGTDPFKTWKEIDNYFFSKDFLLES